MYLYTQKVGLTPDEKVELEQLHADLEVFRKENPDWQAGGEPMRVTLGDVLKSKKGAW